MKKHKDELAGAIHEMATGINEAGLMPKATMRELDELCLVQLGEKIDLGIEQIENSQYTECSAQELSNFAEAIKSKGRQRRGT